MALTLFVCAAALVSVSSVLVSSRPESPDFVATFLLLNTLLAFVGLLLALFCRAFRRHVDALVLGLALPWVSLVVVAFVLVVDPARRFRDLDYWLNASPAEMRRLCHRTLVLNPDPHDAFITLCKHGDSSSVQYVIWALRWMPLNGEGHACTWDHGLEALSTITNCSPGRTRGAWTRWYAVNEGRSQAEWWADGFAAAGYPVAVEGGEASIRNLFTLLGRTPASQPSDKPWLATNARRMLLSWDPRELDAVASELMQTGTSEQRAGVARYRTWLELTRQHRADGMYLPPSHSGEKHSAAQ